MNKDFFDLSPLHLMHISGIDYDSVKKLIAEVSGQLAQKHLSAMDLLLSRSRRVNVLSCGFQKLDAGLRGGLLLGSITEVCGPPGIGKSQLALSCSAEAILNGVPVLSIAPTSCRFNVIYLDTELKFSPSRLAEMLSLRKPDLSSSDIDLLLERICVKRIMTLKDLCESIEALQTEVAIHGTSLVC
jgi:RAD51-like protein 2